MTAHTNKLFNIRRQAVPNIGEYIHNRTWESINSISYDSHTDWHRLPIQWLKSYCVVVFTLTDFHVGVGGRVEISMS